MNRCHSHQWRHSPFPPPFGQTAASVNPAKGVQLLKSKAKPREAWPAELIQKFRETATRRELLLFELCVGTGQRIGDVPFDPCPCSPLTGQHDRQYPVGFRQISWIIGTHGIAGIIPWCRTRRCIEHCREYRYVSTFASGLPHAFSKRLRHTSGFARC